MAKKGKSNTGLIRAASKHPDFITMEEWIIQKKSYLNFHFKEMRIKMNIIYGFPKFSLK